MKGDDISNSGHGQCRWAIGVIVLLLFSQFVCGVLAAARLTVTHDEYWHVPVGLLNWKSGRFDWEPLNPPLLRMWATFPLLIAGAESPRTNAGSDLGRFGDEFLAANPDRFDRLIFWARVPIVLLTAAAGALLARWAWNWHGPWAACVVAWLWARDPNVLGHGSLVTTDAGAAAFWIATLFAAWSFAARASRRWAVLTGMALGLAQAAKFTNVLLVPLVIGLWSFERWRTAAVEPMTFKLVAKRWGVVIVVAWLSLSGAYLFRGVFTPLKSFEFQSRSAKIWQERFGSLAALPVPLPRDYVIGIDRQKAVMEADHPVFLDLEWRTKPFPHYYLMTLVYKLPHSTQALLLWALIVAIWKRRQWRTVLWTLLPSGTLLLFASLSGMQLGIRYILPALPLLFLFVGRIATEWKWPDRRWAIGVAGLLMLIGDSWHSHPEYIAYFNEASGGMSGGQAHLLDSNLDWGQDLHELKEFLREHPMQQIGLAYFGTMPPESLGIRYEPPPAWQPQPGWHVVSVNFVMGRPHGIRDGRGGMRPVGLDEFGYFRSFNPKQRLGASLDVFHLTDDDVRRWQTNNRR